MAAQRTGATRLAEAVAALNALPALGLLPVRPESGAARPAVPLCVAWPDASRPPPAAGPLPNVPDADPLRRPGPAHADRQRAGGRRADPRRAGRGGALHRPLGDRQRPQRLRANGARGVLRRRARAARAPAASELLRADAAARRAARRRPPAAGLARRRRAHARRRCSTRSSTSAGQVDRGGAQPARSQSARSFGGLRGGYARVTKPSAVLSTLLVSCPACSSAAPSRSGLLLKTGASATSGRRLRAPRPAPAPRPGQRVTGVLGGRALHASGLADRSRLARRHTARRWPLRAGARSPARSPRLWPRSCAERMANALAAETSPYLRQHAENPVDWLPWGQEALRAGARARTSRCSSRSATPPATGAT